ncbi:OLC1v1029624C2 [Oldenlandia corymbosa var. corymbosa]|uniref:ATP-dependent RNA helicase n=1 Tax=Oldenlandia corymbosa var. corymbosa TaxID=529605 RepID=A0AAV1CEZ8_OLDCO|nr:OLC1v1029624C2 [Oldenlandia corymbosa var. corymbosa]
MNYSAIFLLQRRSKPTPSLHHSLAFLRFMGGGARTFPGGLNKWQWKRLHEKKAREKEKRLLDQEKQIYQARVRSQIRANLSASQNPSSGLDPAQQSSDFGPVSPQEHIKSLADRFMKEGAEDLWNEDDGPIKASAPHLSSRRVTGEPIDIRKLISEYHNFSDSGVNKSGNRNTSLDNSFRGRNFSSGSAGLMRWSGHSLKVHSGTGILPHSNNWLIQRRFLWDMGRWMRLGIDGNCGNGSSISMNLDSLMTLRRYSVDTRSPKRPKKKKIKKVRHFTTNESSSSEDCSDSEVSEVGSSNYGKVRWPSFKHSINGSNLSDSDTDNEGSRDERGHGGKVKGMMSSAALGKHDVKIKKKVPLEFVEDEEDVSQQVEMIRYQLKNRHLEEPEVGKFEETIYSTKRFDEYEVSRLTVKALNEAGYVQITRVQEAALSTCLQGKDVLVKARTGTGKTAAFLLPAIETALKASNNSSNQRISPIHVLILCPTRELASQIAAEATVLLKYHDGIGVQTLVGGTRFKVDQQRLESEPCQIIVATPGRLLDHVENKSGISVRLMGLKMLILDEADRLLDLGFRKDMEKIVDCLPRQRQSLLFSATIPKEVRRISQLILKREHDFVDTVGYALEANPKVQQSYLIAPHEQHFQIVYHLLKGHISEVSDFKVIVFCTTAIVTSLLYSLLREMKMNVREIHSRKPQIYRTRIAQEFKEAKRLILVTSDVTSRGMNYPDVTLVIQVGVPLDREQYIHRLGRTGREGKQGEGILLLAPWEDSFLDNLSDLPLKKCSTPCLDLDDNTKMEACLAKIDKGLKEAAYHSWLGYYNSIKEISRDKTTLVELANQFCKSIGLEKAPALFRKTALKMGLKDIPGIRIQK